MRYGQLKPTTRSRPTTEGGNHTYTIVDTSMILVNSTHIGLLYPTPIVISIVIRFLLSILIVIHISNINRTLITIDITNRSL